MTLDNLSHDIALQINQAQKIAISGENNKFVSLWPQGEAPRYGVYFENPTDHQTSQVLSETAKQFIYFTDWITYNNLYEDNSGCGAPGNTECLDKVLIQTGDAISDICVNKKAGTGFCGTDVPDLAITFTRPFPDATFMSTNNSNLPPISDAEIIVTSNKGTSKTVVVTKLGQVYIEDTP